MTAQQTIEFIVAIIAGGALTKLSQAMWAWRRAGAKARILEAKAEGVEDANERKAIAFALETLKQQVADFAQSNKALANEHLDCRLALKTIEAKYDASVQQIERLERLVTDQGFRISALMSLLEKHTSVTPAEIVAEQARIQILTTGSTGDGK